MPCRAAQDGQVMVESSDKMWSTGEENGKPLQYSCLENPMNSMMFITALFTIIIKVEEEREKVGLKLKFRKLRSWHLVPSLHGK